MATVDKEECGSERSDNSDSEMEDNDPEGGSSDLWSKVVVMMTTLGASGTVF